MLAKIERIKHLPEIDDTFIYDENTEKTSKKFINIISRIDYDEPFICPIEGGGIQFEWEISNDQEDYMKYLEFEIHDDDNIQFYRNMGKVDLSGKIMPYEMEDDGTVTIKDVDKIKELIEWMEREE